MGETTEESAQEEVLLDAAARDALRRAHLEDANVLSDADFQFVTPKVSSLEKAAIIAVLTSVRSEETKRVKHVERIERQPWRRSQRLHRSIGDLLDFS